MAFNKDKKINNIFFFIALTLFCLGNYFRIFFPFTFLSITVVTFFSYQFLRDIKIRKTILKSILIYFGDISMALFATHGFLRWPFVVLTQNALNSTWGILVATLLFLTLAVIVALSANHVYDFLLSIFNRKNNKQHITL